MPVADSHRPLTIACLINHFPILSETFIGVQIRALERLGHKVIPISFSRSEGPAQPQDAKIAAKTWYILEESAGSALAGGLGSIGGWKGALSFIHAQKAMSWRSIIYHGMRLADLLRFERVDHLQVQFAWGGLAYGIVAARLAGCSVSFVGHGADIYLSPDDLPAKLNHVDIAFASCTTMAEDFRRMAPDARIEQIAMGIELDRLPDTRADQLAGLDFLFVGRLVEKKGLDVLLDALVSLPIDVRPKVDIVGDGPLAPKLKERIANEGLEAHVRMLGAKDSDWVFAHLPSYHAAVVPCVPAEDGDRDTGPLIAKEAMALGVPVIASDFMGLSDIVDASCGISVVTASSEALAAALTEARAWSPEQRRKLGEGGRRKVEQLFTADVQARRIADAIVSA